MFWVYVLQSLKTGKNYIGQTNDLERRICDHNQGKDYSSKLGAPWELSACKSCGSRSEAIKLERKLKNLKSKERIKDYIMRWGKEVG